MSGDFILLTGALGSGKTTLLRDFLATPEAADTAVIVNEAGEIDIDGAILGETDSKLPMALLANGCVSCSIANELLYTVEALVASRTTPFRRIVKDSHDPGRRRDCDPGSAAGPPRRFASTEFETAKGPATLARRRHRIGRRGGTP